MNTGGLILAAGLSSRMGDFKPLMQINQKPLIALCVESMLQAGVSRAVVVLGHRAAEVEAALRPYAGTGRVGFACNMDYAVTDMLASVKKGLAALPPCDAFYLLPGDMPAVAQATYAALHRRMEEMEETDATVVFPSVGGRRKHPPLIASAGIPAIIGYTGDEGLRGVWEQLPCAMAEVADTGCTLDADTLEDYERLKHYLEKERSGVAPA
ncbi:MAG TPA: nucleotidyltransferase family protein [Feifaniaceae bacterium]|nr:nucleotidyltransferase family protein [Feifaniaceae bacterium]